MTSLENHVLDHRKKIFFFADLLWTRGNLGRDSEDDFLAMILQSQSFDGMYILQSIGKQSTKQENRYQPECKYTLVDASHLNDHCVQWFARPQQLCRSKGLPKILYWTLFQRHQLVSIQRYSKMRPKKSKRATKSSHYKILITMDLWLVLSKLPLFAAPLNCCVRVQETHWIWKDLWNCTRFARRQLAMLYYG